MCVCLYLGWYRHNKIKLTTLIYNLHRIHSSAQNNIKQLAIFRTFWLFLRKKIAFDWTNYPMNSTKNNNSNLTTGLIISQEQSWPSGLLLYLISHKWVQCWVSGQNS